MKNKTLIHLAPLFNQRRSWVVGGLFLAMTLSGFAAAPVQLEFSQVVQSSDSDVSSTANQAVDDNASTFSLTDHLPASYWQAALGRPFELDRIEIVNRLSPHDAELDGLTLTLFNIDDQVVYETVLSNPGSGAISTTDFPAGTFARKVRIGLSGSEVNGAGTYRVGLAEVRLFGAPTIPYTPASDVMVPTANLATSKPSSMLKLSYDEAPSSNANDGDYSTYARTQWQAFDGYWEVDLGEPFALYGIRAIAPTEDIDAFLNGFQPKTYNLEDRLGYTIVRLFDEEHNSIHSQNVTGTNNVYEVDLNGPIIARYVRIGLENRTSPHAEPTLNQYEIGFSEVEVFGRAADEVGILSFNTSNPTVSSGQNVTLDWSVEDVMRAEIYPSLGSVGAHIDPNGEGSLSQTVTESTEFILVATNHSGTFTSAVGVEVDRVPLSIQITEVMAENKYSLEDGNGNASDWIELRNTGNRSVDLTGWGLSDNPSNPMKFVFPATHIPPHETRIVFASNKDILVDPAGMLHADFALGRKGETIQLTASDGSTIIDSVSYPALDTDLSYGRTLDGRWSFMEPTPDAINTGALYDGWLQSLDWSHARGFYETNFTLIVTSGDLEATILYSLDGTEPSIPYTAGLPITGTSAVRIQAVWPGYKSTRIQTKTFIFLDDVMSSPLMDTTVTQDPEYRDRLKPGLLALPTISLVVPTATDYPEQMCSMELLWADGQNPVQANCGISRYGGAVLSLDKQSWSLTFRAEYGDGKLNAPLFNGFDHGRLAKTSFNKLQLFAGNHDMIFSNFYMSDRFVQDSMLEMGQPNPHGRFVHVYLNGAYWGQYSCKELLDDSFMADYVGGSKEDYAEIKGNRNEREAGLLWAIGGSSPPDTESWERVQDLRDDFVGVSPYLDVENFIDTMLLWSYGGAEQEFKGCGPKDAGTGYKFWLNDTDRFFEIEGVMGKDRLINTVGPGHLWTSLLDENHPDFKMLLADRMYLNYFNDGAMTPLACDARLVARLNEVQNSLVPEKARWPKILPDTYSATKYIPLTLAEWVARAELIRTDLIPYRTDELISYWRTNGWLPSIDPPQLNQFGGQVAEGFQPELTSPEGVIYYTLDGSDPRLPGGGVSSNAVLFSTISSFEELFVPAGSVWNYLDNGSDQGTAWRAKDFNDSTWSSGAAQLGYGNDGEVTLLGYGPDGANKYTTSYYRHAFEVENASAFSSLDLSLLRDDGAVVYLNGTEILRNNMPDGTISTTTFASTAANINTESIFYTFTIPADLLQEGSNVLAVEIHQVNLTSSDLSFNLSLKGISEGVVTPGEEISLTEDTTVLSRTFYKDEWSALSDARFLVGDRVEPAADNILISEIHYNPDGSDEVEFIELWNSGSHVVDLSGVSISNAVRTIFPENTTLFPGAHMVVVEDTVAFSNRYQNASSPWYWDGIDVAGEWVGGLSDGGERISIVSASGTLISSVRYRSDGEWPERPNGDGSSLELRSPTSVPADPAEQLEYLDDGRHWTASSLYHGSPGRFDTGSIDVVINEVLAHTDVGVDWIELVNSGSSYADLSNMAITDTLDLPARYSFASGTTLDAGAHRTVSASSLGFGFSELGSSAYLLELSGGHIIRIVDSVSFPAVEREEPLGRYQRSDGPVDFTELLDSTPGTTNALPRVGPVVISEIMFVPAAGLSEYVEILNISDVAVPLYDPSIPTNTWTFSGVGDFAFPAGTVLEPNEIALLCATNPATFRSQYGVEASVNVFGPWTGGLARDGEKLQLLNPGDPEFDGFVPMYRADRVSYRINSSWPVANTGGISLERRPLTGYGNDPVSWRSSLAGGSPGEVMGETFSMGTTIACSGQSPRIAFAAVVGESYEVHYTDSLINPDWHPLQVFQTVTTNWIEAMDPSITNSTRYYRILWNY